MDYDFGYGFGHRRKKRPPLYKKILGNPNYTPKPGHHETLQGQLEVCPEDSEAYKLIKKALEKTPHVEIPKPRFSFW